MNMIKKIFFGSLISFTFTIIFIVIFSALMVKTNISEQYIDIIVCIISGICILIGATITSRSQRKFGMYTGLLLAIFYVVFLYIFSSVAIKSFSVGTGAVYMIISSLTFGIIGGIIGNSIKK